MSYRGYEQHICENGHRFVVDSWGEDGDYHCDCGSKSAFYNSVDQTNGNDYGLIQEKDWEKFLLSPAETSTCPTCDHTKEIKRATYRIPTQEELIRVRTFRSITGNILYIKP